MGVPCLKVEERVQKGRIQISMCQIVCKLINVSSCRCHWRCRPWCGASCREGRLHGQHNQKHRWACNPSCCCCPCHNCCHLCPVVFNINALFCQKSHRQKSSERTCTVKQNTYTYLLLNHFLLLLLHPIQAGFIKTGNKCCSLWCCTLQWVGLCPQRTNALPILCCQGRLHLQYWG
jgi:hypothetical protein